MENRNPIESVSTKEDTITKVNLKISLESKHNSLPSSNLLTYRAKYIYSVYRIRYQLNSYYFCRFLCRQLEKQM